MTFPVLRTRARLLSGAAIAMLALGACSSAATPSPAPVTPPPATPAPATSAPASVAPESSAPASASASPSEEASGDTYTLTVVTGAGTLGKYMTGEDDKTLYIFKADTVGSGKSTLLGCLRRQLAAVRPRGQREGRRWRRRQRDDRHDHP